MFHKILLLFVVVSAATINSQGQSTIRVQDYLKNRVVELDNLPESSYQNKTFTPSWIDGVDIRTETDQYDFNRQRYTLRVSPNTPKVRAAQSNLHQLYLKKASLKKTLLKNDFIEIAYEEVLDFYESVQNLTIKEELLVVLEDQEKVWRKLSQRSTDLPSDWMAVQEEIAKIKIEIFKEEAALKMWQVDGIWLNWNDLIPVDSLYQTISKGDKVKFYLQAQEYDVNNLIIEREEELEYAEQKKLLDFLQIEYKGPHTENFEERVSLTAAFRLPFSSSRQLKMEEIAIEKEILQQERLAEKQLANYKEKESRNKMNLLIQELTFTKMQIAQQANLLLNFAEKQSAREGGNPLILLYQKEQQLKKELDILELEMEIYQEYLDYLKLTEQLYQSDFYSLLTK